MSHNRFNALDIILNRSDLDLDYVPDLPEKVTDFYGENVFNDDAMRKFLPEEAYLSVKAAIQSGSKLSLEVAGIVAEAMKKWAMEKGATHYAHWFQPLTGRTAEKHDSFFTLDSNGNAIEEFGAKELAQQEPDGSSFPGGGLRSTFEARGYTAWDPSSPAFILELEDGKTLCIPTIFVTYSGDALDYKLPLLKSESFLERAAIPVCKLFDENVTSVKVTLGWEQEYFLVDEAFFNARPDLVMTGRTLIGQHSPKGQQLDDHYFGSIPERVYSFMRDLETECHRMGIPVRTRHNEVGPSQYELAPMFEEVNIAVDHNQLLMDLMDRIARRHRLRVLLHEKPYAGVNGSGKHNNWSMSTNTGKNLLSPGKNPGKNLRFLTFFVNTIRGVAEYAELLRASVANAGNDHRLGANEAPPAIVSIFVGNVMSNMLNEIKDGHATTEDVKNILNLLSKIPDLQQDNTDRNRTSPFAFTGNKFEIRMVGSSQSCAAPMTVLNTIMGRQLQRFMEDLTKAKDEGLDQDPAIYKVLQQYIKEAQPILFEGDNYSDDWKEEADRRGLSNLPNTPEALDAYVAEKSIELFTASGVLSERELRAHHDVMLENYTLKIDIESMTLEELCLNHVIPSSVEYQNSLSTNILQLKELGLDKSEYKHQLNVLKRISKNINGMHDLLKEMSKERSKAHETDDSRSTAIALCKKVRPLMDKIREHADDLELLADDKAWSLVKYREMMFIR